MSKAKQPTARAQAKKETVYPSALEVFSQYGFRRTTMNDIAQAAGISRPALYLMFDNKEHLFRELAAYLTDQAIEHAAEELASDRALTERFIAALLAHQKVYYDPVANSPHGEELMDTNLSLAADIMIEGYGRWVATLAEVLKTAEEQDEVSFSETGLNPKTFVELLLSALYGIKKKARSPADYKKQSKQVADIFLRSILPVQA